MFQKTAVSLANNQMKQGKLQITIKRIRNAFYVDCKRTVEELA